MGNVKSVKWHRLAKTFKHIPKEMIETISTCVPSQDFLCKMASVNKELNNIVIKSMKFSKGTTDVALNRVSQDKQNRLYLRNNIANSITHIRLDFTVDHGGEHHKLINSFLRRCQKLKKLEFQFVVGNSYCPVSGSSKFPRHWMPWVILIFNTANQCGELNDVCFHLPISFTPHLLTKVNFTKSIKPFFWQIEIVEMCKGVVFKDDSYAICKGGPLLMKSAVKAKEE